MSNIQTVNLADNINTAFDKINENFVELDLDIMTAAEVRSIIEGADLDLGGNKVLFGNVYSTEGDLPSASTYHGMFAHVHATGAAYFAHAGNWVKLANHADIGSGGGGSTSLLGLTDVGSDGTAGQVLTTDGYGAFTFTTVSSVSNGVDGVDGSNYAQVFAYKRVASSTTLGASDAPVGGSFDFSLGIYLSPDEEQVTASVDAGWESTPPSRTDVLPQLYVVTGIASDADLTAPNTVDDSITWGDPRQTTSGTDGQDGTSTYLAVAYRRVADVADSNNDLTVPDAPLGGGIDFGASTPAGVYQGFPISDVSNNQWYSTPPAGTDTLWQSFHLFTQFGNTGQDWATTDRTSSGPQILWSTPSVQSTTPVSTFFKSLYARSDLDLTDSSYVLNDPANNASNGAVYNFTTNSFTSLPSHNGISWTEEMPPLFDGSGNSNGSLWEISTVATLRGAIGSDNTLSFTSPTLILNVAVDGIDGYQVTQVNAYRRAASWTVSTAVTGGSFNFSTKAFTTPTNWSKTVPTGTAQLYVITGVASTRPDNYPTTTTPLTIDSDIEWDLPAATQSGGNGAPGRSTALVVAVTRKSGNTAPNTPTGGSVNFTGGITKTMPTDSAHTWYDDVGLMDAASYNVGGTIWASEATFSISGDVGTDNTATWSAPYLDHNNGADGFSTFQVQIFKRASSTATVSSITGTLPTNNDSNVEYDFDNDGMSGLPSDWSETPQENRTLGNALWMSRAVATVQGDLQGTDSSLSWTTPVIYSVDGSTSTPDFDDMPRESRGYVYYYTTVSSQQTTLAATLQPSYNATLGFSWDDTDGGSVTGLNTNWGMNPTVDTNLAGTLWAARYFAEKSAAGVTTVAVSSAFRSYNFNGLVTFTNLNQELGDASSSLITTIDGGLVKTGTINANLVEITYDGSTSTGGINIKSASSGARTELTDDVIKVFDANGQLRVQLGNLTA